jgi:hypothetical protein
MAAASGVGSGGGGAAAAMASGDCLSLRLRFLRPGISFGVGAAAPMAAAVGGGADDVHFDVVDNVSCTYLACAVSPHMIADMGALAFAAGGAIDGWLGASAMAAAGGAIDVCLGVEASAMAAAGGELTDRVGLEASAMTAAGGDVDGGRAMASAGGLAFADATRIAAGGGVAGGLGGGAATMAAAAGAVDGGVAFASTMQAAGGGVTGGFGVGAATVAAAGGLAFASTMRADGGGCSGGLGVGAATMAAAGGTLLVELGIGTQGMAASLAALRVLCSCLLSLFFFTMYGTSPARRGAAHASIRRACCHCRLSWFRCRLGPDIRCEVLSQKIYDMVYIYIYLPVREDWMDPTHYIHMGAHAHICASD